MTKKFLTVFIIVLTVILSACGDSGDNEDLPDIKDSATDEASNDIKDNSMVKDSFIEIDDDHRDIMLAIKVNEDTSEDDAKKLGQEYAEALGSEAAGSELDGPGEDSLGEIYDYYDLYLGIGPDPDDYIVEGTKKSSDSEINW